MRLTKEEGRIILGAIDAEIESQRYRAMTRESYNPPMPPEVEKSVREIDNKRKVDLYRVRDKIKAQL